jgi:hypothetical protein
MPAPTPTDDTVILHRDFCDVSCDLADVRRSVMDAEDALIDAHSDIRPAADVIAEMVAARDAFNRVIAEAIQIAGGSAGVLSNAGILAETAARR